MPNTLKPIWTGKYVGLFLNTLDGTMEIWQVYEKRFEQWDRGITNKEEAREVVGYAERHYMDGMR